MSNKLQGIKRSFGPLRFSFVNVFEKKAFNNNEPQYSLRALIPKDNTQLVKSIQEAIEEAKKEGASKQWGGSIPNDLRTTIHDGDKSGRPEEAGHWCLNTNNKSRQPGVIIGEDRHKGSPEELKSGDYGYINVTFKAFDYGNKGIAAYLNSVWKTRNGESLAGVSTPEEDFKNIDNSGIDFDTDEIDPLTGEPIQSANSDFDQLISGSSPF